MANRFLKWPKKLQREYWSKLPLTERVALRQRTAWWFYARPNQIMPPGEWAFWIVMAGRGFGKTRTGAETVRRWVRNNKFVDLIGPTAADVRDVMVEGPAGILAICPPDERPLYEPSKRKLTWPNGCISLLFSGEEPERLRGPQRSKLWADELAAWKYAEDCWDLAMMGLRLGDNPQAIITTTPKPIKLIKDLLKDAATVITRGSTYENRENLAAKFYSRILTKYEGTRLGRQEIHAEVLDDNPSALWQRARIDELRVKTLPEGIRRVVVAIDPAVTSKATSDETGIVAAAISNTWPPQFYVLEDASGIYTPSEWATKAVELYNRHGADRVIGEVNNGGDLVEANLRTKSALLPYRAVHASRGKTVRAEPVAALYEQGRGHHVGSFAQLEDEMCDWDPSIPPEKQRSPNRMDALVWAIWELADLGNTDEQEDAGMVEFGSHVQIDSVLDEIEQFGGGLL